MNAPTPAVWIGGPPGAGKTTVALALARRHGLRWYGADTRTWEHRDRALAAGNPAAARWEAATLDERWERPTARELLAMSLHAERGAMVADDVALLPSAPLVVAEGTPIAPLLVASGRIEHDRALWLLPTPDLQEQHLAARKLPRGPALLYRSLAEALAREIRAHAARTVTVTRETGVADVIAAVEDAFAPALAAGPHAAGLDERRALLREANEAVVAQVRGYYARLWASGDAQSTVRSFVCECGDPGCSVSLDAAVGDVAAAPLVARTHG